MRDQNGVRQVRKKSQEFSDSSPIVLFAMLMDLLAFLHDMFTPKAWSR